MLVEERKISKKLLSASSGARFTYTKDWVRDFSMGLAGEHERHSLAGSWPCYCFGGTWQTSVLCTAHVWPWVQPEDVQWKRRPRPFAQVPPSHSLLSKEHLPCSRKSSWQLFRRQGPQVQIMVWKLRHAWERIEEQKREKGEGPLLVELKIRHNVACLEEGEKAGSHSVDFLLRKINLFDGNTRYLDICHPKRKWRQSYSEIKSHC